VRALLDACAKGDVSAVNEERASIAAALRLIDRRLVELGAT
jgi:hypothetical protein